MIPGAWIMCRKKNVFTISSHLDIDFIVFCRPVAAHIQVVEKKGGYYPAFTHRLHGGFKTTIEKCIISVNGTTNTVLALEGEIHKKQT
jgi:hypothetical protein